MYGSSVVTSKGQVTIPKNIRDVLGIDEGTELEFTAWDNMMLVMPLQKGSLMDLAGILHRPGQKAVSEEEMNEAIINAVVEKNASKY